MAINSSAAKVSLLIQKYRNIKLLLTNLYTHLLKFEQDGNKRRLKIYFMLNEPNFIFFILMNPKIREGRASELCLRAL